MRHYTSASDRRIDALIVFVDTVNWRILFTQITHVVIGTKASSVELILNQVWCTYVLRNGLPE
jgi:hypothetical protein